MSFDMSLARGLDYYTGIIYEAVHASSAPPGISTTPAVPPASTTTATAEAGKKPKKKAAAGEDGEEEVDESQIGVGSIAAGGRYDDLVGMFYEASGGKKGAGRIPCVGISVGVERVYSIMLAQRKAREEREGRGKETEVYVVAVGGDGLLKERMALVKQLWDAGIKAEFTYKAKPKLQQQFDTCDRDQTPLTVIIGPKELEKGEVRVRRQVGKEAGAGEGELIKRDELVEYLKKEVLL
jgi:histidyl-tRNA synthetase